MPKNIRGGNKTKSQKNSTNIGKNRDIPFPQEDDDSHVAIITKVQGDGRFLSQIVNIEGTQPEIYPVNLSRGVKFRYAKNIIVGVGTYVLISIREFQKDKGDIIFVYKDSEVSTLVDNEYIIINKIENNDDNNIQFSDVVENNNIEISSAENDIIFDNMLKEL